MKLENARVIVTGGANGIGKALVQNLLDEGAVVGVLDKDEAALSGMADAHPGLFTAVCDVSDAASIEQTLGGFLEAHGRVEVLVNNASVVRNSPLIGFEGGRMVLHDAALWDEVIQNNLSSVFRVSLPVIHHMVNNRIKGAVINVSSVAAQGNAGQSAYSAAKAGVRALTAAWSRELSLFGIRVAGIAPGFTDTETTRANLTETAHKNWISRTPSRRMASPEEMAEAILFIIRNDFVNGKTLEIDGGLTL